MIAIFAYYCTKKIAGHPMPVNVFVPDNVCGNKTVHDWKPSGQTM